jgi:aspartyl-tRNA(Asn)/glutamyl-tRNA(Gln) amidotransferase subunit A
MKPDLSTITLLTAVEQLRRREFTAAELTAACLDRIARLNPTLNAFITPTPEEDAPGALSDRLQLPRHRDRGLREKRFRRGGRDRGAPSVRKSPLPHFSP